MFEEPNEIKYREKMGRDLKGMTLGNPFGDTDLGKHSSSGKSFARLSQNILIMVTL